MKYLLLILLSATSLFCNDIHVVVDRELEDYTVPNGVVEKLNDSRLHKRVTSFGHFDELNKKEGDYVIYIYSFNLNGIVGNTTRVDYYEIIKNNDKFEYVRRFSPLTCTYSGMIDHKEKSINACYEEILIMFPK